MKISIDLTREKFDDCNSVSFYDGKTIFFDATTVLPEKVSFKVWGAGIMPGFNWEDYAKQEQIPNIHKIKETYTGNETIIKGFGTLTFHDVVAGKISISPYVRKKFLKDSWGAEKD